jgi:hypothetical protein
VKLNSEEHSLGSWEPSMDTNEQNQSASSELRHPTLPHISDMNEEPSKMPIVLQNDRHGLDDEGRAEQVDVVDAR